jgi:hypothetical protein
MTPFNQITFEHLLQVLHDIWKFLWSKVWHFVIIGFIAGSIGFAYAYFKTITYTAELTFSIDEEQAASGGLAGIASQFGFDIGGGGSFASGDNVQALFFSRNIIEQSLLKPAGKNKHSFADEFIKANKLFKNRGLVFPFFKAERANKPFTPFQDSAMNVLVKLVRTKMLTVAKPEKKVDIYYLTVTSPEPRLSVEFCNTLVRNVSMYYTNLKTNKSTSTVNILQRKADSIRGVLYSNIQNRAAVLDANLNLAFQQPQVNVRAREIDIQAAGAALTEISKNLEISKFLLLKQTPLLQVIDEPVFPLIRNRASRSIHALAAAIFACFLYASYLFIQVYFSKLKAKP